MAALTDEFLTVPEVARMLRLNVSTVYALAQRGLIPALLIGRAVRIPAAELEKRLLANLIGSEDWR